MSRPAARRAARVRMLPEACIEKPGPEGPVGSLQEAELELERERVPELWQAANLERLARAYWAYLTRVSFGLFRVVYETEGPTVALITRRLPLLRFQRPDYSAASEHGEVTWRIDRGLLVARQGRGRGLLRISIRLLPGPPDAATQLIRVRSEVTNFYPLLRGSGAFARLGARVYATTQLRIHVAVTRGFLRSLARFEFAD